MAHLVSLGEFAAFLGEEPDESAGPLLEVVEATLEAQCGRSDRPFQSRQVDRQESQDGNGRSVLYLDYPIESLTILTVGLDPANLELDLDTADAAVTTETQGTRKVLLLSGTRTLLYHVGSRRVHRLDGGFFGYRGTPGDVYVKYTAEADQPEDASLAVLHAAAVIYRQRGIEEAISESSGGYRSELAKAFEGDPIWRQAVERHQVAV